jgi:starch phosphorylase
LVLDFRSTSAFESRLRLPRIWKGMSQSALVAYLSMEIGLDPGMPTYAGGLGILAGDTVRSCADLGIDMVAVTLLHRRGHFHQSLNELGKQAEAAVEWSVESFAERVDAHAHVEIEGRKVEIGAWRYRVRGNAGADVPVVLLDTDLPANDPADRRLTDVLYGGARRSCSAWAGCACCARSATQRSRAST